VVKKVMEKKLKTNQEGKMKVIQKKQKAQENETNETDRKN
jgi:hypothetical protein